MPNIRVLSIAYDNCLARQPATNPQQILDANRGFIQTLAEGSYDKTYIMIGSARQSYGRDKKLSTQNNNSSCFPVYQALTQAIKTKAGERDVSLDAYLLADSFSGVNPGASFNLALLPSEQAQALEHAACINDHSKVLLLYAQMQKLAVEHPNESIEFNFYDDNDDQVLSEAYHTFNDHLNLIPHTVRLTLNEYKGEQVTSYEPIQGQGIINSSYAQSVKNIEEVLQRNATYLETAGANNAGKTNLDAKEFNTHHYKNILRDFEHEAYFNMLDAAIAAPRLTKQQAQKNVLALFKNLTRIEDINALFMALTERRIQDKLNEHKHLVLDTALFRQKTTSYMDLEHKIKQHALKVIVETAHAKPLAEELKYLQNVRNMDIITRPRHNYRPKEIKGLKITRTASARILDTLIANCELQLKLVKGSYNLEHISEVAASEQAAIESQEAAPQAEAEASSSAAPQ